MASETEPLVSAPRRAGRVAPALVSLLVVAALAAAAASTRSSAAPVAWRAVDAATRFGALDDGALAVASFEVVDTHEPNEHKRVAVATLRRAEIARFPGGGARLAVRYAPSGGSSSALAPLWSRAVRVAADEGEDALLRVEIPLLRLRAAHQYAAELFVSFGDGDDEGGGAARRRATTRFATADVTHCTALSNGAVASVTSGFSYEVLVVPWVEADCDEWEGLIGIDAEGYAVWHYSVTLPGPVGQLSSGDLVFVAGGHSLMWQDFALSVDTDTHETLALSEGQAETWEAAGGCSCKSRCVYLSHECRVVTDASGAERVLIERDSYLESPFGADGLKLDGEDVRPDLLHGYAFDLWAPSADGSGGTWSTLADLTSDFRKYPTGGMMNFALHGAAQQIAYSCDASDGAKGDDDDGDDWSPRKPDDKAAGDDDDKKKPSSAGASTGDDDDETKRSSAGASSGDDDDEKTPSSAGASSGDDDAKKPRGAQSDDGGDDTDRANGHHGSAPGLTQPSRRGLRGVAGFWNGNDDDDFDGGYMDGALDDAARNASTAALAGESEYWRTVNLWHASSGDVYGGWLLVCTLRNANALLAFNVSGASGATLLWTLAAPNGLASDFETVGGAIDFYMPHAVQIYSETSIAFIDDGGSREGCKDFSPTRSAPDAPCWSRALLLELDLDGMTARIEREWAAPRGVYSFDYGDATASETHEYESVTDADYFNLIGGNINYLGDDRFLVAMPDIINATYRAWELATDDAADGGFSQAAELTFSNSHQTSTNGNYRMTPLSSLKGESTTAPLPIEEEDSIFMR